MAYKSSDIVSRGTAEANESNVTVLKANAENLAIPHESYIKDADFSREGSDLLMEGPEGTVKIEGYFSGLESPTLEGPEGSTLTPDLVNSFIKSDPTYAMNGTANDASSIGEVSELNGDATITRSDGTVEKLATGLPVYQGDIIETNSGAAVNIEFVDQSSFAISEETRLALDEFVFDPASQGGTQNFSVLKGVFVYTSGLIGREDPDDVSIATPSGSIGIRGTIIAGDLNTNEITVVEGAIVLRTPDGNEMTLANQFETAKFLTNNGGIENLGQKSANDLIERFSVISNVAPELFSSIDDVAQENQEAASDDAPEQPADDQQEFDADGATDQDGDGDVDGTVDEAGEQKLDKTLENLEDTLETQEDSKNTESESGEKAANAKGSSQLAASDSINFEKIAQFDNEALQLRGEKLGLTPGVVTTPPPTTGSVERDFGVTLSSSDKTIEFGESTLSVDFSTFFTVTLPADPITSFELTSASQAKLNSTDLRNFLDLTQGGGDGWDFDTTTGQLNIYFNDDIMSGDNWADSSLLETLNNPANGALDFSVIASNDSGSSANYNFTLELSNDHITPISARNINSGNTNNGAIDTIVAKNDDPRIYQDGLTVYSNENDNVVEIEANNTVLFTQDGDDKVLLDDTVLGSGAGNSLNNGDTSLVIDGGDGFDEISVNDDANLDFSLMQANGNLFRNIEHIDVYNGATNVVTLRFQDVISMTEDGNHTLVIEAGGLDTVNFDAEGATGGATANTSVNVGATLGAPDAQSHSGNYAEYVYSQGGETVTLLIHNDTAVVNAP